MIFYRVSRNNHKIGSIIWETEIGPNNLARLERYKRNFRSKNWTEFVPNLLVDFLGDINASSTAKEAALEVVREEEYQTLPCRFKHMMVFQKIENARSFKTNFRPEGIIYKIEYPDTGIFFTSDMKILDKMSGFSLESYLEMARTYWKQEMTEEPNEETLLGTSGQALVLEELD